MARRAWSAALLLQGVRLQRNLSTALRPTQRCRCWQRQPAQPAVALHGQAPAHWVPCSQVLQMLAWQRCQPQLQQCSRRSVALQPLQIVPCWQGRSQLDCQQGTRRQLQHHLQQTAAQASPGPTLARA